MSDRLHEIIAQCAVIHETNINEGIINDLYAIEERLDSVDDDIKDHYLTLLMQYYFQKNNIKQLQKLLLQGYRFDMRFSDIKEAFLHLKDDEENVIEFFEDNVVFLKDMVKDEELKQMYDYYHDNLEYKAFIDDALTLIKKNRYVCAHAYKSEEAYAKFFLNEDLLNALKRDMPYILK